MTSKKKYTFWKMQAVIPGEEAIDRVARKFGTSARVGVPIGWIGYKVKVIRTNAKVG